MRGCIARLFRGDCATFLSRPLLLPAEPSDPVPRISHAIPLSSLRRGRPTCLYHCKGIVAICGTPALWCVIIAPLLVAFIASIVSIVVLFSAALYPQAQAFIAIPIGSGWAWLIAVLLTIVESAVAPLVVFLLMFSCVQDKIFMVVFAAATNNMGKMDVRTFTLNMEAEQC